MSATQQNCSDIGLIGLAVMGENLVLNMLNHGHSVSVLNRTVSKVDRFVEGRAKGKAVFGAHTYKEFVESLKKPRRVMIMVRAGEPVDLTIEKLVEHLEKDDIIIDGGNSNYQDTNRRCAYLEEKHGIFFIGAGVSGGEEGALNGPSIMPGGSGKAWPFVKDIFQSIAAKVGDDNVPCCDWVGSNGAGHFVKMVHNGVEYGDMQLICEAYHLMRSLLGYSNDQIHKVFSGWNQRDLDSYLIEITRDIFAKKSADDDDNKDAPKEYVIDNIVDRAGQKGTGKWTCINALELGMPVTLIGEAVFARCLSAQKEERLVASNSLKGPNSGLISIDQNGADQSPISEPEQVEQFLKDLEHAVFAAKIVSYAQGFVLMRAAAKQYEWELNYGSVALMWRGGCIIRSKFLTNIKQAFDKDAELSNLLLDSYFMDKIHDCQNGWRQIAAKAVIHGVPAPAITSALAYFDGYRCARLPSNLLQAQRDFFGAHTYQRLDKDSSQWFHTNWTGQGGSTSSSSYNA
mmetsp:Transcript_15091/g.22600  ORF Transcript_15091/g.22600 Transcript_15091/m.22600 type:complete len:514 (+) Transcript_15091:17-1558(+)